jgi:hypothetical protein
MSYQLKYQKDSKLDRIKCSGTEPPHHPPLEPPIRTETNMKYGGNKVAGFRLSVQEKTNQMKKTAFWAIVMCSLIDVDQRFTYVYCPHHHRPYNGSSTYV